ncbi:protein kinase superfamily protein [Wolffia australiana]
MRTPLAAALGGAAAATSLLLLSAAAFLFFFFRRRHPSDTTSSDPSLPANQISLTSPRAIASQRARCFKIEELGQATNLFRDSNFIGSGKFGDVYKGLLGDMIVAVKRRPAAPSAEFVREVEYLSLIRHRNIVSLLGYCQENGFQMLVYEYVPSGSISSHLYGANQESSEKLEFKHRLIIALGAAKGLEFLHSLTPPLLHTNFKTSNLLVDENFAPKVADAGLRNFLAKSGGSGTSLDEAEDDLFVDPCINEEPGFTERSDVYSFGVFLLELVTGRPAAEFQFTTAHGSIGKWAESYTEANDMSDVVDARMGTRFTSEGMKEFLRLAIRCLGPMPPMSIVAAELDRILERERSLTTIMGEVIPSVTLGSELFTSS